MNVTLTVVSIDFDSYKTYAGLGGEKCFNEVS